MSVEDTTGVSQNNKKAPPENKGSNTLNSNDHITYRLNLIKHLFIVEVEKKSA
jgi:hypothetical protein